MHSSDPTARDQYVKDVLGRFFLDSTTRPRMQHSDWSFANELYDRDVPLAAVEAALILTKIRRDLRPPGSPPPAPIRSLSYFRPIIDEVLTDPPDLGLLHNLTMALNKIDRVRFETSLKEPRF